MAVEKQKTTGLWMKPVPSHDIGARAGKWLVDNLWNLLIHSPVHNLRQGQEKPVAC